MANSALSEGAAAPDQKDWPLFFRGRVAANVRFWLARVAEPQATGELWYEEWHNVVKALGMALRLEATWDLAIDLLLAFHPYMVRQGFWTDWEPFLQVGLEISQRQGDVACKAALLDRLGELKQYQGNWADAIACHQAAGQLSDEVEDKAGCARARVNLGYAYHLQGRCSEAREILEKALAGYQACRDVEGQALAYSNLGIVCFNQRQWDRALASYQHAYRLE